MSDTPARKQFEEAQMKLFGTQPFSFNKKPNGGYEVFMIERDWILWQEAALSRSAEPNSKIIKVALDEHGQKDLTPDEQAECVITQLQLMEKRVDELEHSEFLLEKKLESRSAEPTELIAATETLLEWLPTCSEGSSGYIRRKNVEQAIKNLKAGGSLNGSCRQEASRESDTGGESLELESRSPSTPQELFSRAMIVLKALSLSCTTELHPDIVEEIKHICLEYEKSPSSSAPEGTKITLDNNPTLG